MRDKLESIIDKYNFIQGQMTDQEILSNPEKLKDLAKEYKQLEPVVLIGIEYIKILDQIIDCESLIAAIETSSILSSGSFVVIFCNSIPGFFKILKIMLSLLDVIFIIS